MEPSLGVLLAGFGTVLFNGHPIISEVRRPVEGGRSRFRPKPSRAARTSRRLAAPAAASRLRLLGPLPHCPRFPFAPPPSPHEERLLAANATHVEMMTPMMHGKPLHVGRLLTIQTTLLLDPVQEGRRWKLTELSCKPFTVSKSRFHQPNTKDALHFLQVTRLPK